jgi:hypothetical protein
MAEEKRAYGAFDNARMQRATLKMKGAERTSQKGTISGNTTGLSTTAAGRCKLPADGATWGSRRGGGRCRRLRARLRPAAFEEQTQRLFQASAVKGARATKLAGRSINKGLQVQRNTSRKSIRPDSKSDNMTKVFSNVDE